MADKDDISLKEVVHILHDWIKYLLSKWMIILIVGILSGVLGIVYAFFSKPKYEAALSFILANSNENSSGIMGLASQFGIDLSGDNNDVFTGNNIIALMKSRRMVQQALLKKPEGSNLSLLNIYCKENKLDEAWKKDERMAKVYPFPNSASQMTGLQDSLFRDIYDNVQKSLLDVSMPDKDKSIYTVVTSSTNEKFSYYLTTYLVDVTSAFYISTKTSVAQQNLDMLQHEADSLRNLLGNTITAAAAQTDVTFNLNPAYQVQRSAAQQSQVSASALGQAYGQVLQNLELAKISLQKETPLYQIVDVPQLPLVMQKKSKLIYLIIGGILGGIVICGFLIVKRVLSNLK
ncbi:MAG: lipopolysaccharide biosynthesis protein [Bacteroidetes bacterium]|nr:lipopolysaccharide biosynthesis protein [Bacteroidota bacterium]